MANETVDYELINYKGQIYDNLRYSAKHNKIALLNKQEIEQLALKYFGIPEGGPYTAYMDPYSGTIVPKDEWNKIQLEHIITKQVGGTVLFNCLPVMIGINQSKSNHSLLYYYNNNDWGPNGLDRLSKITDYILEAYEIVFNKYTLDEVENSAKKFLSTIDSSSDDDSDFDNFDSEISDDDQFKDNVTSYIGLIDDLFDKLKKEGIDISSKKQKFEDLKTKKVFNDIDIYESVNNAIQTYISRTYKSKRKKIYDYTQYINIFRLIDSIKNDNNIDKTSKYYIENEVGYRLKNIFEILKKSNIEMEDYFESIISNDITDLLYKNNVTSEDIYNINLTFGINTKINKFIDLINHPNYEIISSYFSSKGETFSDGSLVAKVWQKYRDRIINKLFNVYANNNEYGLARKNVLKYLEKIYNRELTIEEYLEIEKEKINKKSLLTPDELNFQKNINIDLRIKEFIDIINSPIYDDIGEYFISNTPTFFKNYPNTSSKNFWSNNHENIIFELFYGSLNSTKYEYSRKNILLYYSKLYDTNIQTIDDYYYLIKQKEEFKSNLSEEEFNFQLPKNNNLRINEFINMINKKPYSSIEKYFSTTKDVFFENYPNTSCKCIWFVKENRQKIIKLLFEEPLDLNYDFARDNIIKCLNKLYGNINTINDYYEFLKTKEQQINNLSPEELEFQKPLNKELRINEFIKMLNKKNYEESKKLLNNKKITYFDRFPNTQSTQLWSANKNLIIQKLFYSEFSDKNFSNARNNILIYLGEINDRKFKLIDEYFEFKREQNKLKENLSEDEFNFQLQTNKELRINEFIEMLNNKPYDECKSLFSSRNKIYFDKYPHTLVTQFWQTSKKKIIQKLFFGDHNLLAYENARKNILTYLSNKNDILFRNIEEYLNFEEEKDYKRNSLSPDEYEFQKPQNLSLRINEFIEMLNNPNYELVKDYFNSNIKTFFENYPKISSTNFWASYKNLIVNKLFFSDEEKQIHEYSKKNILKYFQNLYGENFTIEKYFEIEKIRIEEKIKFSTDEFEFQKKYNLELRIFEFIKDINDESYEKIKDYFHSKKTTFFKNYPNTLSTNFWQSNKFKIIEKLFYGELNIDEFSYARKNIIFYLNTYCKEKINTINDYFNYIEKLEIEEEQLSPEEVEFRKQKNLELRIDEFIKTINKKDYNLVENYFIQKKPTFFENYPNTSSTDFWQTNKFKIIEKLFNGEFKNSDYDCSRKNILQYLKNLYGKKITIEEYLDDINKKQAKKILLSNEEKIFQKLSNIDLRIDEFINMINKPSYDFVKDYFNSSVSTNFEKYPNTSSTVFWFNNKLEIIQKLFYGIFNQEDYIYAQKNVLEYFEKLYGKKITIEEYLYDLKLTREKKQNLSLDELNFQKKDNVNLRIIEFINMVNKKNYEDVEKYYISEIDLVFENYPNTSATNFFLVHKSKIVEMLYYGDLNAEEYKCARDNTLKYLNKISKIKFANIEEYLENENKKIEEKLNRSADEIEFRKSFPLRIDAFINMINQDDYNIVKKYFNQNIDSYFDGYPNVSSKGFWHSNENKYKIINKLFHEEYNILKYKNARDNILLYLSEIYRRKITTIDEYYEYEKEKKEKLSMLSPEELAFSKNLNLKVKKFIEMINYPKYNDVEDYFNSKTNKCFQDYPNVPIKNFWYDYSDRINKMLKTDEYCESKYDYARRNIDIYSFSINIDMKIEKFIEMINYPNYKDVEDYFKGKKPTVFKDYEDISSSSLWTRKSNKNKIINKLFYEEYNTPEYEYARKNILKYFNVKSIDEYYKQQEELQKVKDSMTDDDKKFNNDQEAKINCFIDMINDEKYDGIAKYFIYGNNEKFNNHSVSCSTFWHSGNNRNRIIHKLFFGEFNTPEYDYARKNIKIKLEVNEIGDYIKKLDRSKKENKLLTDMLDLKQQQLELAVADHNAVLDEITMIETKKEAKDGR